MLFRSKMFAGKFSGKRNDELFIEEQDNHCILKKFSDNNWITLIEDSINKIIFSERSTQVCGNFTSSSHEVLLSVYQEANVSKCVYIEFVGRKLKINIQDLQEPMNTIFSSDDILCRVHKKGESADEIFSINNRRRFELKNIKIDKNGFYISSTIEFSGFPKGRNPKYYEFPYFVPGRFTENNHEVLCILRNCSDKDFDGRKCSEYDAMSNLPNAIQLYSLQR